MGMKAEDKKHAHHAPKKKVEAPKEYTPKPTAANYAPANYATAPPVYSFAFQESLGANAMMAQAWGGFSGYNPMTVASVMANVNGFMASGGGMGSYNPYTVASVMANVNSYMAPPPTPSYGMSYSPAPTANYGGTQPGYPAPKGSYKAAAY